MHASNTGSHANQSRGASDHALRSSSPPRIAPDAFAFAEMYIFSYGVAVFWNFTPNQEKDVLADLTFFSAAAGPGAGGAAAASAAW